MFYLFLANGFEEIEALATVDVLRRAEVPVLTVGVSGSIVEGSHGIKVEADILLDNVEPDRMEGIILPGGMPGTLNLFNNETVIKSVEFCAANGLLLAAICAAPLILGRMNLLDGKEAVCFPGFEDELKGAKISDNFVCTSDNVVTAKGMGSAVNFGIAIVAYFKGQDYADSLKSGLQCS